MWQNYDRRHGTLCLLFYRYQMRLLQDQKKHQRDLRSLWTYGQPICLRNHQKIWVTQEFGSVLRIRNQWRPRHWERVGFKLERVTQSLASSWLRGVTYEHQKGVLLVDFTEQQLSAHRTPDNACLFVGSPPIGGELSRQHDFSDIKKLQYPQNSHPNRETCRKILPRCYAGIIAPLKKKILPSTNRELDQYKSVPRLTS